MYPSVLSREAGPVGCGYVSAMLSYRDVAQVTVEAGKPPVQCGGPVMFSKLPSTKHTHTDSLVKEVVSKEVM